MSVDEQRSPLLTPPSKTERLSLDSQPSAAAPSKTTPKITIPPVDSTAPRKSSMSAWGSPAGLAVRNDNDENLVIFRRALGINTHLAAYDEKGTLEEGRKTATGIYRHVIQTQTRKHIQHVMLQAFLYMVYCSQIIIGAALTALGASAIEYQTAITALGVLNTVLAGVLALIKGSGQPQNLGKDRICYRRLQDWIEETEALLAVGVIGRNRREVGHLVESAFKRYNAAKTSEEINDPDYYAFHKADSVSGRLSDDAGSRSRAAVKSM